MFRNALRAMALAVPAAFLLAFAAAPASAVQRTVTIYQIQDTTAVGHVVMVGVMSMTPVHIRGAGHGAEMTLRIVGIVISVHVAGMYAFSPVMGWLSDRWGKGRVIIVGVALLLAACLVAGTAGHDSTRLVIGLMLLGLLGLVGVAYAAAQPDPPNLKFGFYAAMAVSVIGFAFTNPSVSALVSKRADPARQGEVLGVNQAFASLGRILGPFLGSVLFQAGAARSGTARSSGRPRGTPSERAGPSAGPDHAPPAACGCGADRSRR